MSIYKSLSIFSMCFLLISLLSLASCNGQGKSRLEKNNDSENLPPFGPDAKPDGQVAEYIRNIHQDKNGHFWFGTNNFGVAHYNGESVSYYSYDQGFSGGQITGMTEDQDGNIWFATNEGVTKYDWSKTKDGNKLFTNYFQLFNGKHFWSIFSDSKGNIWAGFGDGVYRFDGENWGLFELPYTGKEEVKGLLTGVVIWSITEDFNGDIWFGTNGNGAIHYDGKSYKQYTEKDGLSNNDVDPLIIDKRGNIWMGTRFGGINVYDGMNFVSYSDKDSIGNNEVCIIHEDNEGNIWFSSEGFGVYKYNGTSFRNYSEKHGLGVRAVQTIFQDNKGEIWAGGGGGLYRLKDNKFINIKKNGPWTFNMYKN